MHSDRNKGKTIQQFRSVDYRDSKYHGSVLIDPQRNPIKEGPGILLLDRNHCIISKWNNNQMDGIDSIILTSSSQFLDLSGEDLPIQMKIKIINPLIGYIIYGNLQKNQWIIQENTIDCPVYLKLHNTEDEMMVEQFQQLSQSKQRSLKYERQDQYRLIVNKIKRILLKSKSQSQEQQNKPKFKIHQNHYSSDHKKQNKLTCSINSTYPEYLNIQLTALQSQEQLANNLITLPLIKSIAYWNSYQCRQLYYKTIKISTSFLDEPIFQCEDCIGQYQLKYVLNFNFQETNTPQKVTKQQINAYKKYVDSLQKLSSPNTHNYKNIYNGQTKKKQKSIIQNARQLKKQYHMISVDFVNASHHGFTRAVQSVTSVMNKVYEIYKKQATIRWSGHPNNKIEQPYNQFDKSYSQFRSEVNDKEKILPNSRTALRNNQNYNQYFEATDEDLKNQLIKINKGEYKKGKSKPKKSPTKSDKLLNPPDNHRWGQESNAKGKLSLSMILKLEKYKKWGDSIPVHSPFQRTEKSENQILSKSSNNKKKLSGTIYSPNIPNSAQRKIQAELIQLNKASQFDKKIAYEKRNSYYMNPQQIQNLTPTKKLNEIKAQKVHSPYSPLKKSPYYDQTISKQHYQIIEGDKKTMANHNDEISLSRLTNSYLTISEQIKSQSSKIGIPYKTSKKRQKIWQRDYKAALNKYNKVN